MADKDDIPTNGSPNPALADVAAARLTRRGTVAAMAGAAAAAALPARAVGMAETSSLTFKELSPGSDATDHWPEGYERQVLIRWGDPVLSGAPAFEPGTADPAGQVKQFGYNNDFLAFLPLPLGSKNSRHGLLWANHEYTNPHLMFPGITGKDYHPAMSRAQAETEMAAHGGSIIEIKREGAAWRVAANSEYARRIDALSTEFRVSGPAAGHARLKTSADPTGTKVIGMLNNCAGGVTPWGTILSGEENFNMYFGGGEPAGREDANHRRYGVDDKVRHAWHRFHARFDPSKEPNEPNRFGWIVEIDPYDPKSVPVKRTALGRMKHEGAGVTLAPDGRVVCYMGDDQIFEYIYRFVSKRAYDHKRRGANRDLLDEGELSVARFDEDGVVRWLPLVFGRDGLTPDKGFESQADVLIETRRAADIVGGTRMDRPEDVDVNPVTGRVYAVMTNNSRRKADEANPARRPNAANPRGPNPYGHVIEIIAPAAADGAPDHAAPVARWDFFILAGDPRRPEVGAFYRSEVSRSGWISAPDNVAFDPRGRMWIATDQGTNWGKLSGTADGLYGCEVAGPARGAPKLFYRAPVGAEVCGPCMTPDGETVFIAVQHPAEDDEEKMAFERPSTRWPDFKPDVPPRPSVIAITRKGGGKIGG